MPRHKKVKATEVEAAQPIAQVESPKAEKAKVTLRKNGFIEGKLYKQGETVEVTSELKDYLVKSQPETYL